MNIFCLSATQEGDLILLGGPSPNEGSLGVYHDGEWGKVCDFGPVEATVACRQMGLQ